MLPDSVSTPSRERWARRSRSYVKRSGDNERKPKRWQLRSATPRQHRGRAVDAHPRRDPARMPRSRAAMIAETRTAIPASPGDDPRPPIRRRAEMSNATRATRTPPTRMKFVQKCENRYMGR